VWAWRASGVVEVTRSGECIVLSRQSQRLVAGLLVARGRPVDADVLVDRLWDHPRRCAKTVGPA
jgi:DNA-binding SARP family transcriptional activator